MIKKSLIIKSLILTAILAVAIFGLLFASRYFYGLMWSERFWKLLGGDFLEGGYIQSSIYFCGILNYLLINKKHGALNYQRSSFHHFDKILRPANKRLIFITTDLNNLKNEIERNKKLEYFYLSSIIKRVCAKYRTTNSVSESLEILSSQIDSHSELAYANASNIRYLNWCIPSLGFIGTIFGISGALSIAASGDINSITSILGVAFDTTLVALVINIYLTLKCNQLQSKTDKQFIYAENYITDHLINNIEVKSDEEKKSA